MKSRNGVQLLLTNLMKCKMCTDTKILYTCISLVKVTVKISASPVQISRDVGLTYSQLPWLCITKHLYECTL